MFYHPIVINMCKYQGALHVPGKASMYMETWYMYQIYKRYRYVLIWHGIQSTLFV